MSNNAPNPPVPNTPMTPMSEPGSPTGFIQVWINALTKPNEGTFATIASLPGAKSTPAFIWVFITSLVQSFVVVLAEGSAFRQMLSQQGLGNQLPQSGLGGQVITLICGAPILAVITVIFFAIGVALVQWVAKMFGGRGTFDQLAYTFGAIAAPMALVYAVFLLLGLIPFVGICFRILAGFVGLYAVVLEIMAVKGVHGFGWGQAVGSVLLPGLVVGIICCCAAFGISALVGASLGNVLSGMGPFPVPTP